MAKYFFAENCNRTLRSNGLEFNFTPIRQFGGTWEGIYEARTDVEQAALSGLAADKASAVRELTEAEYEQKKILCPPNLENFNPLPQPPTRQQLINRPAVLVESPGPENQAPEKVVVTGDPLSDVEQALQVTQVSEPKKGKITPKRVGPPVHPTDQQPPGTTDARATTKQGPPQN